MITQTYTLSLQPGGAPLRIPCVQRDANSRDITFDLTSGGVAFSPPDGAVITIDGTKPDGKSFSAAGTISGSTITVTLSQQMTAVAGDVPCQLTITSGTAVLGTARFILAVSEAAIPTNPDLSSSDMSVFETLKNAAAQSASAAAASAAQANAAADKMANKVDKVVPSAPGNVAVLDANGNLADSGITGTLGTWTPVVSGATSYTNRIGTYLKMGNLVLIQFYAYGTFGGSTTEKFSITGCPFSPATASGGGGIISGYTSAANIIPTGWQINQKGHLFPAGQATGTDGAKYNSDAIYQKASGDFMAAGTIAFRVS